MFGLTANLSLASQALEADTGAITVTNNNIANVNTPGYDRQTVNLSAVALAGSGTSQDGGVSFDGYSVVRDQLLQLGINQKTSQSSALQTQSTSLAQIENSFSSATGGLGASLSNLFSNLSALSTAPNDAATRETAYSSARALVDAFHAASSSLFDVRSSANADVAALVGNINQITTQIASLNTQLVSLKAGGGDGGTVQNEVDQLTTQLAQLTGISSTVSGSATTLATESGSPLVAGDTAYALSVSVGADGQNHVFDSAGQDITAQVTSGSLGGALMVRDTSAPQLSSQLDQLASEFGAAINAAQATGYDQSGNIGHPVFTLPTDGSSAAANISLSIAGGASFALSSDGSSGSSGNLANLLSVQTKALSSGQTPSDAYASFVQAVGSLSADAKSKLSAVNSSLQQLQTQQSTESGVSVDEETTNLLRYQQAYSAAAQVISTVNNLFSVVLNMGGNN